MNKKFLFLVSMLLLLVGCSSEDKYADEAATTALSGTEQIHWYGMQLPQSSMTRGVANGSKLWEQEDDITVKFLNPPYDRALMDTVKVIAAEWEKYCNIHFDFVRGDKDADVRIVFDWKNNDWLTWSYTGTDAKSITSQWEPTAALGGLQYMTKEQMRGDILRIFGQILGLEYEQRHQQWSESGYWKDESRIQKYWEKQLEGYLTDWNVIRDYVFTPLTNNNTSNLYATKDIDKQSIMVWPYYTTKESNLLIKNNELSAGDIEFIGKLYPKNGGTVTPPNPPVNTKSTIQKAWVDAGYFTWTNTSKTALKITKLGAMQEYLPDVSDGEQLRSAEYMFYYDYKQGQCVNVKLKKAPQFNTSNITNFRGMFYGCSSLESIPLLNTSNGNDFSCMFYGCSSLVTIPQLNTSKGIGFGSMFTYCSSLTEIPPLNTSQGTSFQYMFYNCSSLRTKPQLDLSRARDKRDMYTGTRFGW